MAKTICIAGKNNIAITVAKYVQENYPEHNLIAITNQTDNGLNNFQLSYKQYCNNNGIKIVDLKSVYNITDLIFLSLEFDKIIKPNNFKSSHLFNIHFSYLPAYKGMYTSALPIINNEVYSGVTLHKIDAGIDTGDIIDQKKFEIGFATTGQELYLKYIQYGTGIVIKNLDFLINGNYTTTPQTYENASYYSKKTINYTNLSIDVNKTALEIYNQIRAFAFPAYQLAKIKDSSIYHSRILVSKSYDKKPGEILHEDDFKLIISTIDFDIELLKDKRKEMFDAIKENNLSFLKNLKEKGYPLNQRSKEGWDCLIIAAYNGKTEVVKWLIEELDWDVNTTNNNGTSFAMYVMTHAANSNNIDLLKYIKNNYKNINWEHIDTYGKNIFHYANQLNNPKVIDLLCP